MTDDKPARLIFDSPIRLKLGDDENLWEETNEAYRAECRYLAAEIAERAVKPYRAALEYASMGLGRIHNSLTSTAPKQAVGEMTAHFSEAAQNALSALSKARSAGPSKDERDAVIEEVRAALNERHTLTGHVSYLNVVKILDALKHSPKAGQEGGK
jgi:hypothetical protein